MFKIFPFLNNISNKYIINKLKIDNDSIHYITFKKEADIISKIIINHCIKMKLNIPSLTITDATAGVGGNTISFGHYFSKIFSIEIDKKHYIHLINNITLYKLYQVTALCEDSVNILHYLPNEIVFIDPPWGGFNCYHFSYTFLYKYN
jgi:predicted RNA methylase